MNPLYAPYAGLRDVLDETQPARDVHNIEESGVEAPGRAALDLRRADVLRASFFSSSVGLDEIERGCKDQVSCERGEDLIVHRLIYRERRLASEATR